ncbi:hypothetical protein CRE_29628 [Caenorhabditis remanei]|uniref:Uncharacterized protein n=1 Tax=Caenorhabditis remanei TaxID=31234 RepID=E3LW43_CAERE|nr:hypothetical protein CRE_29628 [Caenorhabditis remanei]
MARVKQAKVSEPDSLSLVNETEDSDAKIVRAIDVFDGSQRDLYASLPEELRDLVNRAQRADLKKIEYIVRELKENSEALGEAMKVLRKLQDKASKKKAEKLVQIPLNNSQLSEEMVEPKGVINDEASDQTPLQEEEEKEIGSHCSEVETCSTETDVELVTPSIAQAETTENHSTELSDSRNLESQLLPREDEKKRLLELENEVEEATKGISRFLGLKTDFTNLSEAVQSMQASFQLEHGKHVFSLTALEAKNKENEKLALEKNRLEETVKKVGEEKKKESEELQKTKTLLKKTRKEKDNAVKKLKRIADKDKPEDINVSERLSDISANESGVNTSNYSVESSGGDTTTTVDKKSERRIAELQRSTESLRKRYEEVCQKLETSEKSLEIQQELNAQTTSLSAEQSQKQSNEISDLKETVEMLKTTTVQQQEELIRIKQLERTKTDVLVSLLEDEKQSIRDECDSLKHELERSQKALLEQKSEAKKHLENELWKLKKAAKSAEKRKSETPVSPKLKDTSPMVQHCDVQKVIADLTMLQEKVKDASSDEAISKIGNVLQSAMASVEAIANKANRLEAEHKLKDQVNEELRKTNEENLKKYENSLSEERRKCAEEVAGFKMQLEELDSWMEKLREQEKEKEAMRMEYQTASEDLATRILSYEREKAKFQEELYDLKKDIDQKTADFRKVNEEKLQLQRETEQITKQLEESLSPKKDKAAQLESRLEVIQVAAKAQQKRLDEDLKSARIELQEAIAKCDELQQQNEVLQEKLTSTEKLTLSLTEKLSEVKETEDTVVELQKTISQLKEENSYLQSESAQDRSGLVTALVATQNKLTKCQKAFSVPSLGEQLTDLDESQNNVDEAQSSRQTNNQTQAVIEQAYPDIDSLLRQLVHHLAQNQNYMYGVFGIVIYIILIHLYILL